MKSYNRILLMILLLTFMRGPHFAFGKNTDTKKTAQENADFPYTKKNSAHHSRAKITSYYSECLKDDNEVGCYPETDSPCIENRDCPYLVTWRFIPDTKYVEFTLINPHLIDKAEKKQCDQTARKDKTHYIAIGFSHELTIKNPRIAVVECSGSTDTKNVQFGWSSSTEYMRWNYTCDESTAIGKLTRCTVEMDETTLLCRFQIQRRLVFMHDIFNFDEHQYNLYLTSGCDITEIEKSILRGGNQINEEIVAFHQLKDNTKEEFRSHYALWHGSLMLLAWCFLVPNGMFLSRYFKESFVDVSIFKYRLWFAGHSIIMITAFLFTLGGMGTILQERLSVDLAWPADRSTRLHFELGIAASLLLTGQVSIGWIRCHGRALRRTFGTLHLLIGLTCYILSMVCIAVSFKLGMPCSIKWYTVGSALLTLICHVIMTFHFYRLDKQFGLFVYRALYPFPIPPVTNNELPGTNLRLTVFLMHFIGSFLIVILVLSNYLTYTGKC